MRFSLTTSVLLGSTVTALPSVVKRQATVTDTENDLINGPCQDVTFIFARGTSESGNIGGPVGPGQAVAQELRNRLAARGQTVAIQGVDYLASIPGNAIPPYGDPLGVAEMMRLFQLAHDNCPETIITGGGYSQGAGLTHGAIPPLSDDVRAQIAAIVNFGDTQEIATNKTIANLPPEDVLLICNDGDLICEQNLGYLNPTPQPHLEYNTPARVDQAVEFFLSKIN